MLTSEIEATIRHLIADCAPGRSISPNEVARALAGPDQAQWRRLMKPIRQEAVRLAKAGQLAILRKGQPVDPDNFKGVYRLTVPARS